MAADLTYRTTQHTGILLLLGMMFILAAASGKPEGNGSVVQTRAVMSMDAAHADSPLRIAVLAQISPGYHINAHKPSLDYLIPTELKLDPGDAFTVKSVIYPKGTPQKFEFSDIPLAVYEGTLAIGVVLQSGKGVPPGTYTLKGKLGYQACNAHACLAPTSAPFSLNVKVVPRNMALKPVESNVFERIQFE